MAMYEYVCPSCGEYRDLVRPIGHEEMCSACGKPMVRSQVHHFQVVGPTVDTMKMARDFSECAMEREHIYKRAEARVGHAIPRPDDWSEPKRIAAEMVRRGEDNAAATRREMQSDVLRGGI